MARPELSSGQDTRPQKMVTGRVAVTTRPVIMRPSSRPRRQPDRRRHRVHALPCPDRVTRIIDQRDDHRQQRDPGRHQVPLAEPVGQRVVASSPSAPRPLSPSRAPRAWRRWPTVRLFATAVQATVPRIARPIAPPTCWPMLSSDDATPVSACSAPSPAPPATAARTSAPCRGRSASSARAGRRRTCCARVIRDSQNMPPAASSGPPVISGRAPIRATSCEESAAPTMIMATIGRYAIPERTGA